jgi:hypothetical protein
MFSPQLRRDTLLANVDQAEWATYTLLVTTLEASYQKLFVELFGYAYRPAHQGTVGRTPTGLAFPGRPHQVQNRCGKGMRSPLDAA